MSARSVKCWPCTKRKASRSVGGMSKVKAIASRVSRATVATLSGWNLLIGVHIRHSREACPGMLETGGGNPVYFSSVRLEVVERLEAVLAAVLRLAWCGTEPRQLLGAQRTAARARDCDSHRPLQAAHVDRARRRSFAGRGDTVGAQALACRRRDPVRGPCRLEPSLYAKAAQVRRRERALDVLRDNLGRRTTGIGRSYGDHDL